MQVKPIPAAVLNPATELIKSYVPELTPTALISALRAFCPDATDTTAPRPAMSLQNLGKLAGVNYFTLLREIKRGKLRAVKCGSQWRIPEAEAARYLGQE